MRASMLKFEGVAIFIIWARQPMQADPDGHSQVGFERLDIFQENSSHCSHTWTDMVMLRQGQSEGLNPSASGNRRAANEARPQ